MKSTENQQEKLELSNQNKEQPKVITIIHEDHECVSHYHSDIVASRRRTGVKVEYIPSHEHEVEHITK